MKILDIHVTSNELEDKTIHVTKEEGNKTPDDNTFVLLEDTTFHNGVIEMDVKGSLLQNADINDRGFIGFTFRVNEDQSEFECFYIRPTNGNTDDVIRKQHGCQYFSYPGYTFSYFRKHNILGFEAPIEGHLDKWFHLKGVIENDTATFYVDDKETLRIDHLKHGDSKGKVGLYVDNGTDGYFKNISIQNTDNA